jgi:hypothetical protein
MAIMRYLPGEVAPDRGAYGLVGHYGEPTGVAVWREQGERLPLVTAEVEYPLWFVSVGVEIAKAA